MHIEYLPQLEPRGLADAFLIGEEFLDGCSCALALGDNIFYGSDFYRDLNYISKQNTNCVFGYRVSNPRDYGVVEFKKRTPDSKKIDVIGIEEKPETPKSN